MYYEGSFYSAGGTSASAPIFSSVINRINEERIAVGKGPVGFINPTLYAHPEVLNDVYNGTNNGCGDGGFPAVEGWVSLKLFTLPFDQRYKGTLYPFVNTNCCSRIL